MKKRCHKCNIDKELTEFSKHKKRYDGHQVYCKDCIKEYFQRNKEEISKRQKAWRRKHKIYTSCYDKQRKIKEPWKIVFKNINSRCHNPKRWDYKYYGGRGIKQLLSIEGIKILWFRDKAYLMRKPTIDRIDNDGNYILKNCRFIENIENLKRRHRKL